ncbi:hypothetical protein JTE90_004504 [Oedothorax gibbosus]|uniref:Spidroin N-terminal domain-containing protein n=1 Tax=Oedothorax gibbosus TaxID=931172 RepID=A0AAV6U4B4_9ARAC|nr:hypothetical protein JTE90_004504 [Oedothorax gibbosus]
MDWYVRTFVALFLFQQGCFYSEARGIDRNNPFASYDEANRFTVAFVKDLLKNNAFGTKGEDDMESLVEMLLDAMKNSNGDSKNTNDATTAAKTMAFLSAIAELLIEEAKEEKEMRLIPERTQKVVEALKFAFKDTGRKENHNIINQFTRLVEFLLSLENYEYDDDDVTNDSRTYLTMSSSNGSKNKKKDESKILINYNNNQNGIQQSDNALSNEVNLRYSNEGGGYSKEDETFKHISDNKNSQATQVTESSKGIPGSEPISISQPNLKQPSPQSTTMDFKRGGSPPGTSPVDIYFETQGGTDGTLNVSPNNQYVPTSGPQTPPPPSPDSTEPVLRDTKPSTKDTPGSSHYTSPITTQGRSSSPASPDVSGVVPSNGNPAVPGLTQQSVPKTGSVPQLQSSAPNSIPGNSLPGQQSSPSLQPGGSIQSSSISSPTDGSSRYQQSNRPSDNIPALRSPEPQSSTISEPISNSQPNLKQPSPQSTTVDFKRAGSQPGTSPVHIHFAAHSGTDGTPNVFLNNQYVPTSGPQTPTPPSPDSTEPVLRDTKPSTKDTPGSSQYTGPSTTQLRSSSPASPEVSGVAPFNGNPAVPGLTQQSVPKPGSVPQLQSSAPNSIPGNSLPGQQTSPSSQPGGGIQFSSISSPTDGSSRYQPSNRPSDNIPALKSPEPQSSTISEPISNSQPNLKQPSPQSTAVDFKRAGSQPGTSPVDIHFAAQGGTDGTPNVSPNNQYVPTSGPQTPTPPSPDSTEPVLRDTKPSTKDTPVSRNRVSETGSFHNYILRHSILNSYRQQTSFIATGGSIQSQVSSLQMEFSISPAIVLDNSALKSEPQSSTISEPIRIRNLIEQPSPQSTTVDFKRAGSPPEPRQ